MPKQYDEVPDAGFSDLSDLPVEDSFHELSIQHYEDDHVANQNRFMR